jgi:thiamine pyrophosphate-dependent acetolactate synthase large subunit-like protein
MLMAEFSTCVKYKLPVKVVVVKNKYAGPDQMGADGILG